MTASSDPTAATAKKLFARSRNLCAYPTCANPLVDGDVLIGELCHIRAASEKGPRYDAEQSADDRRAPANFIVLCSNCHKKIDTDLVTHTVAKLVAWKSAHEGAAAPIDEPPDALAEQLIRTAQISVRIESEFAIVTFGQLGGYTAGVINIYHSPQAAPVGVPVGDFVAQLRAEEDRGRWWALPGETIVATDQHQVRLAWDTGTMWGLRLFAGDFHGAPSEGPKPDMIWDLGARSFATFDVDVEGRVREELASQLSDATPLARAHMSPLQVQIIDTLSALVGKNMNSRSGAKLRQTLGLRPADKLAMERALARLSPRYVQSPAYLGDGQVIGTLFGLLQSERAAEGNEVLQLLLRALRAEFEKDADSLSLPWARLTDQRSDLTDTHRDLASFILWELGLSSAPGPHPAGPGYAWHLKRDHFEAAQACDTPADYWKSVRDRSLPGAWPSCPMRIVAQRAE